MNWSWLVTVSVSFVLFVAQWRTVCHVTVSQGALWRSFSGEQTGRRSSPTFGETLFTDTQRSSYSSLSGHSLVHSLTHSLAHSLTHGGSTLDVVILHQQTQRSTSAMAQLLKCISRDAVGLQRCCVTKKKKKKIQLGCLDAGVFCTRNVLIISKCKHGEEWTRRADGGGGGGGGESPTLAGCPSLTLRSRNSRCPKSLQ